MADLLKQQHHLLALKTSADRDGRTFDREVRTRNARWHDAFHARVVAAPDRSARTPKVLRTGQRADLPIADRDHRRTCQPD